MDEQHFQPLFFANDVEDLRNNPEARKVLKQYKIFTGENQKIQRVDDGLGDGESEKGSISSSNFDNLKLPVSLSEIDETEQTPVYRKMESAP
jgi:hypothetical protein